jgi:hypothetical protein
LTVYGRFGFTTDFVGILKFPLKTVGGRGVPILKIGDAQPTADYVINYYT